MSAKRRPPSPQPRRRQVAGIRRPGAPSPRPRPASAESSEGSAASTAPGTSESTADTPSSADESTPEAGATDTAPTDDASASAESEAEAESAEPEVESEAEADKPAEAESDKPAEQRPKPRAKTRTTGVRKPSAEPDKADERETKGGGKDKPAAKRSSVRSRTIATGAIGVVLLAAAIVFGVLYGNVRSTMANHSMSDPIATQQVKGQVEDAVKKVFSYQWNKLDAHEADVNNVLAKDGKVRKQYDMLFPDVKKRAPKQKLTVTTKVTYSSVLNLTDDSASLLVYLEQSSWRGNDQKNKSAGGGFLRVDAKLLGDKWRIANFDIYKPIKPAPAKGSPAPNGSTSAPKSSKKAPASTKKPAPTTKKGH